MKEKTKLYVSKGSMQENIRKEGMERTHKVTDSTVNSSKEKDTVMSIML